jgi:hypothetical protein
MFDYSRAHGTMEDNTAHCTTKFWYIQIWNFRKSMLDYSRVHGTMEVNSAPLYSIVVGH